MNEHLIIGGVTDDGTYRPQGCSPPYTSFEAVHESMLALIDGGAVKAAYISPTTPSELGTLQTVARLPMVLRRV